MYWRASSQLVKIGPTRALRTHAVQQLGLFLAVVRVRVGCEGVGTSSSLSIDVMVVDIQDMACYMFFSDET